MHVAADLNWFLQVVVVTIAAALGLVFLVRNAASRYFVVDSNFGSSATDFSAATPAKSENMGDVGDDTERSAGSCAVCGHLSKKQCARCKMVKYCSEACQNSHWSSDHKNKCMDLQSFYKANNRKSQSTLASKRAAIDPVAARSKILKPSNKILFPYEEFANFFNWDKLECPPCGLLNCGNSCFANVVLQCLAYTRPLVAYLVVKGHRTDCHMDDWCFFCEFETHVEKAGRSSSPFSPMNILSRLPNIGGNLGYGKQEDAHEFMRFAIDTMQLVCLDEFGGEKVVHPMYQETTLIQHIFGGRLRSQVICAECNNISNQFENMMDLTVEIHGDAGSLEECLDQFTAKEKLHGDNLYRCDGCNDYVMAWKRLTVQKAPNILTIALKRFQSGRFGKLNKRVTFPETLDLRPYMSELEDESDVYKLYAVVVHVDMLNASFFGHYICYIKDFRGNWYRIDDCKVSSVELDEVLSQGAYMLLYSRILARPSCLLPADLSKKVETENTKVVELQSSLDSMADVPCHDTQLEYAERPLSGSSSGFKVNAMELSFASDSEDTGDDKNFTESSSPADTNLEVDQTLSTAPEEAAPLVIHPPAQICPPATSVTNQISTPSDPWNPEPMSSTSVNSSINGVAEIHVSGGCGEDSTASQNCTVEAGSLTWEWQGDVNSHGNAYVSSSMSEEKENTLKVNGVTNSSDGAAEAAKKLSGGSESSAPKFKPLFPPGFLGKPPQRGSSIRI